MSEQTTTEVAQEEVTPVAQEQVEAAQLQLSDLVLCMQAIQLATARGAFRAEEFTQVGGVFDRVTAFLKASGAIQTPTASESADQSSAE